MITTKESKNRSLLHPLENFNELVSTFGADGPKRIADIGACDGLSSIKYCMTFLKAIVTAFEPREDNYKEMEDNIKEYGMAGRIITRRTALGDHEEKNAKFYRSYGQAEQVKDTDTGKWSSSLLRPKEHLKEHTWCHFKEDVCDVTNLDSLKLGPFDFIHIDVQGAELKVLNGAQEELKQVEAIWMEVANIELYEGQPTRRELLDWLGLRRFKLIKDTCCDKKYGDCFLKRVK
jgi:FkbM family methyltransferase